MKQLQLFATRLGTAQCNTEDKVLDWGELNEPRVGTTLKSHGSGRVPRVDSPVPTCHLGEEAVQLRQQLHVHLVFLSSAVLEGEKTGGVTRQAGQRVHCPVTCAPVLPIKKNKKHMIIRIIVRTRRRYA